jgi:DNA topoisomerase-1
LYLRKALVAVNASSRRTKTGKVVAVRAYTEERAGPVDRQGKPLPPSTPEARQVVADRGHGKIPPTSWGLRVAADPEAAVQAVWRDRKGREQRLYHSRHTEEAAAHKFAQVQAFAKALPKIRRKVQADLRGEGGERARAAAAIVSLIDATTMRVGSEGYAQENGTYGASSLRKEHVHVEGSTVHVAFRGKHGVAWERSVENAPLAAALESLMKLPGERVFQHQGARGLSAVDESAVREYLKPFGVSPKQFRTYHAARRARELLLAAGKPEDEQEAKRKIAAAVKQVASELGNTPAVCRSSYINPAILDAYAKGLLE